MAKPYAEFARLREVVREFVVRRSRGEALSAARYLEGLERTDDRLERALRAAEAWDPASFEAELRTLLEADPTLVPEQAAGEIGVPVDLTAPAPSSSDEGAAATLPQDRTQGAEARTIDGRYRVERELGQGGFGAVYLVEDQLHGRERRALKVILPAHSAKEEFARRFQNEIRVLRTLSHPGIPQIFNDGRTAEGAFYYTMAFVEGRTLSEVLKESGPMLPARIVRLVRQMISILDYAHQRGVVHRDLKPANIMLLGVGESEAVRVLDFGIAKILSREGELEGALTMNTSAAMGTPHYMSPEQVRGRDVDERTDIYALGIIIYQMCSGLLPFSGTSVQEIATARLEQAPKPLAADKAPPWLRELVMSLLERDKDQRPGTAEILARLETLQDSQRRPSRRRLRSVRWIGAALALLLAGFAYAFFGPETRGADPQKDAGRVVVPGPGPIIKGADGGPADLPDGPDDNPAIPEKLSAAAVGLAPKLDFGGLEGLVSEEGSATWYVRALPVTLEGSVTGSSAEHLPKLVLIDDREVPVDRDGRFTASGLMPELDGGERHRFRLEVEDAWQRKDVRDIALVVDATPPLLELKQLPDSGLAAGGGILARAERATLAIRIEEDHLADVRAWRLAPSGGRTLVAERSEVAGGALHLDDLELEPGPNRFEVQARDRAGNESLPLELEIKRVHAWVGELKREGAPDPLPASAREVVLRGRADGPLGSVKLAARGLEPAAAKLDASDPTRFELRVALPRDGERFELSLEARDAEGDPLEPRTLAIERAAVRVPAGCALVAEARITDPWAPGRIVHTASGIELVLVDAAGAAGAPASFFLGRTEVTWKQYTARVPAAANVQKKLAADLALGGASELDAHPAVILSFAEAQDFCEALGLRLPTREEWDWAATEGGKRRFTWGDDAPGERAQVGALGTAPAGSHPLDVATCGAFDLAGNVREWCGGAAGAQVLAGGCWSDAPDGLAILAAEPRVKIPKGNDTIGLRVACPAH